MSTVIDKKSYLQKYLSGSSGDKKKKKKKAIKGKGFKIIDDDIDLSKLRALDGDELDVFDEGEDAPQIAGIIDDRPEELKQLDQLKSSSKWKVISQDDGFNSKLQIEEIKKDHKEAEKENELIFGKMYSDSEDEKKNDSDLSPPRKHSNKQNSPESVRKHNSDSDFSPPRKTDSQSRKNQNSDDSHKGYTKRKERLRKPSRWGDKEEVSEHSDHKQIERNTSPKLRTDANNATKKSKRNYDSDESPPRKSRKDYNRSTERKYKKKYDNDPPKRSQIGKHNRSPEVTSPSKRRKHSPRQDYSYRNNQENSNKSEKYKRKHSSDSDLSPPRKTKHKSKISENNKRKYNSDSDASPPRRQKSKDKERERSNKANDSPPPTNKKMAKTLEGKLAGLQDARQLRQENYEFRKREDEVYNKMSDEVSGRNAKAVSRKGKRETSEERQKQKEKAQRQKEIDEKYKKWSRGLKQLEDQEARVQEFLHEASKPLARHKGDRDLEDNLKQVERAGDPMLKYIKDKKRERGELAPEKPSYRGSFPPNRFNIRPGYRWDGVDRSNGYEKKYFEQQSKKKAQEEEAYKWSTEDL